MQTILIADREPSYRQQIRKHIGDRPGFRVVGECGNSQETIRFVNALEPDVLFLDVQLPGDSTFELVKRTAHQPKVIFTAQRETYAMHAFDCQAIDYLLKPYGEQRLDAALQKVANQATNGFSVEKSGAAPYPQHLFVEDGDKLRRIAVDEIRYFKAAGDYTVVYATKGEFLSSSGIGAIANKLDGMKFVRVHRSFIVNIEYIDYAYRDIGRLYLLMESGPEINVGKHYAHQIKSLVL